MFTKTTGRIWRKDKQFKKDLDWWVSPVHSRNTNISNLFNYICILESLKILDRKKKFPKKIIVSSYQLKKIIIQNFKKKNFQVIINKKPLKFFKTTSLQPGTSVVMIAQPLEHASINDLGKPSLYEGRHTI